MITSWWRIESMNSLNLVSLKNYNAEEKKKVSTYYLVDCDKQVLKKKNILGGRIEYHLRGEYQVVIKKN